MAEALLITRNDVVKFTAMNGNVDTDNFIQYVKIAQDIHIQNYSQFSHYCTRIKRGVLS